MKRWIKVQIKDVIPVISLTGYRTWPCPKDARKSHQGQRAPSSFCPNKQACLRTVPWCTGTSRAYHTGIAEFMSSRRAVHRNIRDFNTILWYMYTSTGVFYPLLRWLLLDGSHETRTRIRCVNLIQLSDADDRIYTQQDGRDSIYPRRVAGVNPTQDQLRKRLSAVEKLPTCLLYT